MTPAEFERWRVEHADVHATRGKRDATAVRDAITGSAPDVRIRRAASIVVAMHEDRFKVINFVTGQTFACRRGCLELLAGLEQWAAATSLIGRYPDEPGLGNDIARVTDMGAIVVEGSGYAALDEQYRADWAWGEVAGLFHFGIKNVPWATAPEHWDRIDAGLAERPSPALYQTNEGFADVVELSEPDRGADLFATMAARRSRREFGADPISLEALGWIVRSGLAITEFTDEGPFGVVPLKMTPSGGARNPYEGFVLVENVEGLDAGIYHYSAAENSLGAVRGGPTPPPAQFLAELEWINAAAAVVFLVANFPRTAWKYGHPVAYRTILIEAGHIAQNMLLAATALDVAATPIAALCDSVAESALGLDPCRQGVVHAVVLGCRREE